MLNESIDIDMDMDMDVDDYHSTKKSRWFY
jgi:hypothetical protein